jgi:hypothetical protein
MKIEMGKSLFYLWLRHVKECQVVQTNWKPSPSWPLPHEEELQRFMSVMEEHFQNKYGYGVYKNNLLSQLLTQAEVDLVGICMSESGVEIHALEVAFHEGGLNYGDRQETVMRVMKKFMRTDLCLIGYFGAKNGEILFASPKIHKAVMDDLEPCITDLNGLFRKNDYNFTALVITHDDFNDLVLKPILLASDGVSDTSELFMRGYQLVKMFGDTRLPSRRQASGSTDNKREIGDSLSELKIGKIAQTCLREVLESGKASDKETGLMRTKEYSKRTFGLNFPLLVLAGEEYESVRYYAKPLVINGVQYRLCSQWFHNDRQRLLAWLDEHGGLADMDERGSL